MSTSIATTNQMRIDELLSDLNINYQTEGKHCRPGWVQMDCFWCGGPLYLGYNIRGNYANCWRCGPHSSYQLLKKCGNFSQGEIKELLTGLKSTNTPQFISEKTYGKLELPEGILDRLLPIHRRYLKERGLDPNELANLWGLRSIGIATNLAWRIFIPIQYQGKTVSWTTRSCKDSGTRYVSAASKQEQIPAKQILFGADYVRHTVVVCEGPFDVFRIGPGAVATLGVQYSRKQLLGMIQYPIRVICFDNEPKAQERAKILADDLQLFPGETYNVILSSKDPGSASEKEIRKLRRRFLE